MEAVGGTVSNGAGERIRAWVYALLLAVLAGIFITGETASEPNWAGDGYTYSIQMLMDRGVPYERARALARDFYRDKPAMRNPHFHAYFSAPYPEYWQLFAPRVLYPWIASLLAPRFGMDALLVVSNLAYVVAALAVYLLLLAYARAEIAALTALGFALTPIARLFGRSALTDMLAAALWAIVLLAMCRFAGDRKPVWLLLFTLAALAMTLARPLPYVPLVCAAALFVWAWPRKDRAQLRAAAFFGTVAFALCVVVVILEQRAGSPSFAAMLQHLRIGSRLFPHASLAVWYVVRVGATLFATVAALFEMVLPPIGFALLWLRRAAPDGAILAGGLASTVLTVAVNPIVSDVPRVAVLPLLPIAAAGVAVGLEYAVRSWNKP